jgi:hypothetical protein
MSVLGLGLGCVIIFKSNVRSKGMTANLWLTVAITPSDNPDYRYFYFLQSHKFERISLKGDVSGVKILV